MTDHALSTDELVDLARSRLDPDDLADVDLDGLAGSLAKVGVLLDGLRGVQAALRRRIAEELGEGGAYGYGTKIIRYARPSTTWKVRPAQAQPFVDFLAEDAGRVLGTFTVRKTDLREVVATRGLDLDPVVDTFIEEQFYEPTIQLVDRERAPAHLASLADGEVWHRPSHLEVTHGSP